MKAVPKPPPLAARGRQGTPPDEPDSAVRLVGFLLSNAASRSWLEVRQERWSEANSIEHVSDHCTRGR